MKTVKTVNEIPRIIDMVSKDWVFNFVCYDSGSGLLVFKRESSILDVVTIEIDVDYVPTLFRAMPLGQILEMEPYAVTVHFQESPEDKKVSYQWAKEPPIE